MSEYGYFQKEGREFVITTPDTPMPIMVASTGITPSTPSTSPRLPWADTSVTQALKAASFAVDPKNVISASSTMTRNTAVPTAWGSAAAGKRAVDNAHAT